ncbi:hypothetical protein [uncultured Paraglaciecola sp.]|uniref:hypothetical protein n=1 Tax=uncultured Paraglaciecola sp. TaxID=1765024 RepID=UPI002628E26C|nr:hypothetical protein [uncultured Paraglaciecola sp.]
MLARICFSISLIISLLGFQAVAQQAVYELDPDRDVNLAPSSTPAYFDVAGQYLFYATLGNQGRGCCFERTSDYANRKRLLRFDSETGETLSITDVDGNEYWSFKRFSILNNQLIRLRKDGLFAADLAGKNELKISDFGVLYYPLKDLVNNGKFVYYAYSESNDRRLSLVKTDGTSAGTSQIQLCPTGCQEILGRVKSIAGTLYFTTLDYDGTTKIWMTDAQGHPQEIASDYYLSRDLEHELAVLEDDIYFISKVNEGKRTLKKKTRSGQAETLDLKTNGGVTLHPYLVHALPNSLAVVDRYLYLVSFQNGKANVQNVDVEADNMFSHGNVTYFAGKQRTARGDSLWRTDGTVAGTYNVTGKIGGKVKIVAAKGNKLFIHETDTSRSRNRIWVSDGTDEGTSVLLDVELSEEATDQGGLVLFNEAFYFSGKTEQNGSELWRSDGTQQGTHQVNDLAYAISKVQQGPMFNVGDQFVATLKHSEYIQNNWAYSSEFWAYDINTLDKSQIQIPHLESNEVYDGIGTEQGFFWWQREYHADNGDPGLFYYDFTNQQTTQLTDADDTYLSWCSADYARTPTKIVLNNTLFFIAYDGTTCQLWASDGRDIIKLTDFSNEQFYNQVDIQKLYKSDSYVYFSFNSTKDESELRSSIWRSDGTVAGTKELVNINSAELTNAPTIGSLSANSDVVYFSSYTYDTELEYQLWRFKNEELKVIANGHQSLWISGNFKDGIIFNTQQSAWYLANNSDTPEPFFDYFQVGYSYGDTKGLYTFPDESAFVFGAKDSVGKVQFWLSDGTLGGTEALFELPGLDFQVYGLASNDIYYGTIFQQPTAPSEIHLRQYSLTKKTNQLIYTQPSSTGFRNFPVVMNNNKVLIKGETPKTAIFTRNSLGGPLVTARLGEADSDKDGVVDALDAFPLHRAEHADFDQDGIGDNADLDDDNDGINDFDDYYPLDGSQWRDSDNDGFDDVSDEDDDNDGVTDWLDAYPYDSSRSINAAPNPQVPNKPTPNNNNSESGGGSLEMVAILLLVLTALQRIFFIKLSEILGGGLSLILWLFTYRHFTLSFSMQIVKRVTNSGQAYNKGELKISR